MSLSFIYGGSGAGKSTYLYDSIIKESLECPDKHFYIIVPDQFTMQTQMELTKRHPHHGIMNIDILSFGRLAYRVFEEVGIDENKQVLDDTGKNLILRVVANHCKDKLQVLGGSLKKQGYIHEIKSAISEFMQYGLDEKKLQQMIEASAGRKALSGKLTDLKLLYESFEAYIAEHYITKEETLQVLAEKLGQSEKIRNSVVAFDGFTGFTPIQLGVISMLLQCCEKVYFTVLMDEKAVQTKNMEEQNLFALSRKTVKALERIAKEEKIKLEEDIILSAHPVKRLQNAKALAHLEENLFRYPSKPFAKVPEEIKIMALDNPLAETKYTARTIRRLVREEGYEFRHIGVVCGNIEAYEKGFASEFGKLEIPYFMDQNTGILLNPFIEFIRSGLLVVSQDFSLDSICHYVRCGFLDIAIEEIDELDNYIREMGIKGKKKWTKTFTRAPKEEKDGAAYLIRMNQVRARVVESLEPILEPAENASERVRALYRFIEQNQMQEKMLRLEERFAEEGDRVREKQYHQIYPYIIDLLSEIDNLLAKESLTDKEFEDLLDAGFSEMQVGIIPQNVDHVVVGDIERTRLNDIKVLFFVGVNDGNIPKNGGTGGIISDLDREFLHELDFSLAPSPREQMYIQRLYLYMNMTKPSEKLYLTFAATAQDGKTMRPSYLIDVVKKLYPELTIEKIIGECYEDLETARDSYSYLSDMLRRAANQELSEKELGNLFDLIHFLKEQKDCSKKIDDFMESAFGRYQELQLPANLALALYGNNLTCSITRLETFAACAYEHFLKYGLALQERKEFGFEAVDMGNIFHQVLAEFSKRLPEIGFTWFDFPKEEGEKLLDRIVEDVTAAYGNAILFENARNRYMMNRISRILKRTVSSLQYQIKQGDFEPKHFEMGFHSVEKLEQVDVGLSNEESMKLIGRIDRIDVCTHDNKCYIKVIDYKSGNHQFDIVAVYHGLQLQLVTYLKEAMDFSKKQYPDKEIVPAGILYYHLDDPLVEITEDTPTEEINIALQKALRLQGVVNDDEETLHKIDREEDGVFHSLPLKRLKSGALQSNGMLMTEKQMTDMSEYVTSKIKSMGKQILQGDIGIHPYEKKGENACTYCPYLKICRFDKKVPGYQYRSIEAMEREAILEQMKQEDI